MFENAHTYHGKMLIKVRRLKIVQILETQKRFDVLPCYAEKD